MGSMTDGMDVTTSWWAKGLLFENCSCQLVCPGHMHFDQLCTHERCKGFWAIRFDAGEFGTRPLSGARAVIVYDCPQHMIDGGWTEGLIIDASLPASVREPVERILTGRAGGPWAKLASFVSQWLETRYLPIVFEETGTTRRVSVDGWLQGEITEIRGKDRTKPVTFQNIFNQIHASEQVLARGGTRYNDGIIVIDNHDSHGLYSKFSWSVRQA
jgi:hypothetical protein